MAKVVIVTDPFGFLFAFANKTEATKFIRSGTIKTLKASFHDEWKDLTKVEKESFIAEVSSDEYVMETLKVGEFKL